MSDVANDKSDYLDADIRTPEMEMAELGAGVPDAATLALQAINPANPHLFKEDRWPDHFARLRADGPAEAHRAAQDRAGRFGSQQKTDELLERVAQFEGLWAERRANPGFDLVSKLANGEPTKDIPTLALLEFPVTGRG